MADTPAQVALDEKGLLPCPFCGADPKLRRVVEEYAADADGPAGEYDAWFKVQCDECGAEQSDEYRSDALANWNRRTSLSAEAGDDGQGALVERGGYRFRWHENSPWTVSDTFQDEAYVCEPLYADAGSALTRENAALRADKERLERERDYAVGKEREVAATIKRVWAALGNPEFETLHGRTISEVVADWKERAEAAERRLAEQGQAGLRGAAQIAAEAVASTRDVRIPAEQGQASFTRNGWEANSRLSPHATPPYATPPSPEPDTLHEFKNFHRNLCERFDYCHDEKDWQRDQVSLIEHIARKVSPEPDAELVEALRKEADSAYCRFLDKLGKRECLGEDAKLQTGDFGLAELNAHREARELLGFHRGIHHALEALARHRKQGGE